MLSALYFLYKILAHITSFDAKLFFFSILSYSPSCVFLFSNNTKLVISCISNLIYTNLLHVHNVLLHREKNQIWKKLNDISRIKVFVNISIVNWVVITNVFREQLMSSNTPSSATAHLLSGSNGNGFRHWAPWHCEFVHYVCTWRCLDGWQWPSYR